jgi:fructose-bisphosphate aldolase class II
LISFQLCNSDIEHDGKVGLQKNAVDFVHRQADYVMVEGELEVLVDVKDDLDAQHVPYASPEEVEEFAQKCGVDSLGITFGKSHDADKFPRGANPQIRFDILHEIQTKLAEFPIVLERLSSIPLKYVERVNTHGGRMPKEQLREASQSAVWNIRPTQIINV